MLLELRTAVRDKGVGCHFNGDTTPDTFIPTPERF